MQKSHVNISGARSKKQKLAMEKISHDGVCPFCDKNLSKYHPKPIIKSGDFWTLTENAFPYTGTRLHLLLISKKHISRFPSNTESLQELSKMISWVEKKYDISGGSLVCKFGDTTYNNASVDHLHMHIIVGDIHKAGHRPVRVIVG